MKKFKFSKKELELIENSCVPSAVYQFVDNKVFTLAISKGLLELFGLEGNVKDYYEILDKDRYRECHPDDIAMLQNAAVTFATKEQPYNVVYRTKIKDGYKIIHAYGKHIYKGNNRLAVIWYTDEGIFKENSVVNKDLLNAAYSNFLTVTDSENVINYDYLTGFPTIAYFFYLADTTFFTETEKLGKTPVMLFLDLNGMRYFNARFGFAEGDNLIRAFSRLLIETFTNNNCCRFGMDRFCVVTDDNRLEERLWDFFSKLENINDGKTLTARVGIYSTKVEKCSANKACDRAKLACDSSKNYPISHFTYFDKSMLAVYEKQQYIIDNIDRAINENWISVYYQPIIRAANDKVCDEEALSRWIDPQKGFMNPAEFIPILEESNLIYKLDLYVIEQVLVKMKQQKEKGLYIVPISVNLSRSDFSTCDIVEEIQKRVKASDIPPEKLTIEITESIIGKDYDYMKSQIKRFQDSGFKVWIDDFGSGYSSLDVLHDIPFNLIKFDMKFMQQFYKNEKSKIILSGLMKTAMNLGIETICEGVETEHQVNFLKEIGCTKLQGYYYCQPLPVEKIFERYDKGIQIGFENPDESEYFASLGKINLYDLSSVTNTGSQIFQNTFNTLPMAIFEIKDQTLHIVRGNNTYREFLKKYFDVIQPNTKYAFKSKFKTEDSLFLKTTEIIKENSNPIIIDEDLKDGINVHVYMRRIAINPVTGVVAFVIVILGVNKRP